MSERFHEDLGRIGKVEGSSDRVFGFVFAVVFLVIGLWPLLGGSGPRFWSLFLAGGFALLALAFPRVLSPLNRLWTRFGLLLHRIVSPLVLGLIFTVAVTPVALMMRLFGKDPLRRRYDSGAESYWIEREDPGPAPETMRNQF